MKIHKHISIILAFLILVSSVGLAFNVHYCGNSIASISFVTETNPAASPKKCCEKIIVAKKKCCNDKVFHFQQKSDCDTVKAFSFLVDYSYLIKEWKSIVFYSVPVFKKLQITSYYCDANGPPLYTLLSQYIFYA